MNSMLGVILLLVLMVFIWLIALKRRRRMLKMIDYLTQIGFSLVPSSSSFDASCLGCNMRILSSYVLSLETENIYLCLSHLPAVSSVLQSVPVSHYDSYIALFLPQDWSRDDKWRVYLERLLKEQNKQVTRVIKNNNGGTVIEWRLAHTAEKIEQCMQEIKRELGYLQKEKQALMIQFDNLPEQEKKRYNCAHSDISMVDSIRHFNTFKALVTEQDSSFSGFGSIGSWDKNGRHFERMARAHAKGMLDIEIKSEDGYIGALIAVPAIEAFMIRQYKNPMFRRFFES